MANPKGLRKEAVLPSAQNHFLRPLFREGIAEHWAVSAGEQPTEIHDLSLEQGLLCTSFCFRAGDYMDGTLPKVSAS